MIQEITVKIEVTTEDGISKVTGISLLNLDTPPIPLRDFWAYVGSTPSEAALKALRLLADESLQADR